MALEFGLVEVGGPHVGDGPMEVSLMTSGKTVHIEGRP
jgi:hypothetical protein